MLHLSAVLIRNVSAVGGLLIETIVWHDVALFN
jgi:hypothetical protein